MRLLIADDHAGVRKFIRELMAGIAAEICECADGEETVRVCGAFRPDFVIMDLQMPGMDGFEATRRLAGAFPRARVIAVSHLQHPEMEARVRRAGACSFIAKENLAELPGCISRLAGPSKR